MKNSVSISFVREALLLLFLLCLGLFSQVAYGEEAFTYQVRIDVRDTYRELLENNLEIMLWRNNTQMNLDQLRRIYGKTPEGIRNLLATEGYFSPKIMPSLEKVGSSWLAKFKVEAGEPVLVEKFALRIEGVIKSNDSALSSIREKILNKWSLNAGKEFRQLEWEQAKRTALQAFLMAQYPGAKIAASQATVDIKQHKVALELVLDSGPEFTFGKLEISGLKRYPASMIEQMSPIESGELFSQLKLLDFQTQLQNSAFFSSALVEADADSAHPKMVPIKVEVVELQPKKLGFGFGYSTNIGKRFQTDYQDINFRNKAWGLRSKLKLETYSQSIDGELQFPMAQDGYRDSLNSGYERMNVQGEITTKYVAGAKRSRLTGNIDSAITLQYQTEWQNVAGFDINKVQALIPGYSWTQRNVDDAFFPTRGYVVNWQISGAKRGLLSDRDFIRGYGKLTGYYPLSERDNLMFRGELGAVVARVRQDIPTDVLFRAGGDQSIRGYAYQSLGVRQGNAIVGGRSLAVATAEYTHWFSSKWGSAIFYDVGNALDSWKSTKAVEGYGLGARWKSPVGPLNLDLAYGREVKKTRIHFSVGLAF